MPTFNETFNRLAEFGTGARSQAYMGRSRSGGYSAWAYQDGDKVGLGHDGDPAKLKASLEARGYEVFTTGPVSSVMGEAGAGAVMFDVEQTSQNTTLPRGQSNVVRAVKITASSALEAIEAFLQDRKFKMQEYPHKTVLDRGWTAAVEVYDGGELAWAITATVVNRADARLFESGDRRFDLQPGDRVTLPTGASQGNKVWTVVSGTSNGYKIKQGSYTTEISFTELDNCLGRGGHIDEARLGESVFSPAAVRIATALFDAGWVYLDRYPDLDLLYMAQRRGKKAIGISGENGGRLTSGEAPRLDAARDILVAEGINVTEVRRNDRRQFECWVIGVTESFMRWHRQVTEAVVTLGENPWGLRPGQYRTVDMTDDTIRILPAGVTAPAPTDPIEVSRQEFEELTGAAVEVDVPPQVTVEADMREYDSKEDFYPDPVEETDLIVVVELVGGGYAFLDPTGKLTDFEHKAEHWDNDAQAIRAAKQFAARYPHGEIGVYAGWEGDPESSPLAHIVTESGPQPSGWMVTVYPETNPPTRSGKTPNVARMVQACYQASLKTGATWTNAAGRHPDDTEFIALFDDKAQADHFERMVNDLHYRTKQFGQRIMGAPRESKMIESVHDLDPMVARRLTHMKPGDKFKLAGIVPNTWTHYYVTMDMEDGYVVESPGGGGPLSFTFDYLAKQLYQFKMIYESAPVKESKLGDEASESVVWLRLGDGSEYERFDDVDEAAQAVAEIIGYEIHNGYYEDAADVVQALKWRDGGFELDPFIGHNYCSLYWGDDDANMDDSLDRREQVEFVKSLKGALKEFE